MRSFNYKNENSKVVVQAAGYDMQHLAAECCMLVNHLYSAIHRQEPMAAMQFQLAVMLSMTPDSPVWEVKELSEGGSCTMVMSKK